VIWVFLIAFLALIALLLWLPLEVCIESEEGIYAANWGSILRIRFAKSGEQWRWLLRLFWWETPIEPSPKKEKPKKPAPKKRSPMTPARAWALAKNLFAAIRIKRFYVDLDTGDYLMNAWLTPLAYRFSKDARQIHINFEDRLSVSILLRTCLGSVAGAALRTFFHSKITVS
jgi:hypothetical protein